LNGTIFAATVLLKSQNLLDYDVNLYVLRNI